MLILFVLLFAAVVAAHFAFARYAWGRLRGATDTAIDLDYIRRDDWLAQSFRSRVAHWTATPAKESYEKLRVFQAEGQRLIESTQSKASTRATNRDIYSFTNDFACFPESAFGRELSVHGKGDVGAQSRLQAITTGSSLKLGSGSKVTRWADSDGEMTLSRHFALRHPPLHRLHRETLFGAPHHDRRLRRALPRSRQRTGARRPAVSPGQKRSGRHALAARRKRQHGADGRELRALPRRPLLSLAGRNPHSPRCARLVLLSRRQPHP
jgi:hypothetical protein